MNLRKRIFLVLVSLLVVLGIAACTSAADTVKIAFGSDEYTVKEGQTISLDINITTGSNYDAKQVQQELVYSSSDPTVAKFVNGELIGVGIGETEIKVEWSQKAIVFDKAKVTVLSSALPEIVFEGYSPNMLKGASQTIGYRFNPVYTDAWVRWESANPDVAVVDENGQVTAVAVGDATIIAYATDGVDEKAFVLKLNVSESDFAIEYVLNGGVNSEENPAGYNTLNTPLELAAPTKAGYEFKGWYADEELTQKAGTIAEGSTGDVKVYAKWEVVNYNINYDLDGGVNAEGNPATYTVEDEVTLAEPTKENHSFLGWVDAEGNVVTKIAKGSVGDVNLKATWKLDVYNINYDLNGGAFPSPYRYASYEAAVNDFLADYNKHSGKSYTAESFAALGSWEDISAASTFFYSQTYRAKWSWLIAYIETVASAANKPAFTVFYDYNSQSELNAANSNHIYRVAYELRGWVGHFKYTSNASFVSYDYSLATYEDLLEFIPVDREVEEVKYEYAVGEVTKLPTPEKENCIFVGWGVAKEETITASSNTNYWGNYENHIFLFKKGAVTSTNWAFRVSITRQEDGSYVVSAIGVSGDSAFDYSGDYVLMISDSYGNVAATQAFKDAVKVGDVVSFDGDPSTGNATITLCQLHSEISADSLGDLSFTAVWADARKEFALSYELNGGTISGVAPSIYSTEETLKLEMTASKPGYKFLGWSLSKGGAIITEIAQGTRDDLTLYANYELETYKIEYDTNGGTFSVDSIAYIYDNYDALVADFIADYSAKYGLTGVTPANFNSKSSSYGLIAFWNDAALSAKWAWLQEFMLGYNTNYSGLSYMKNASSAANYNKYWRANLAAFLQQGKVTSPLSMDFTGIDTEAWWATNVPTKVVTVAANPKYEYTVEELPFVIEVPMRDGVEFVGWCFNDKYRDSFTSLPAGTIGDIKLYAKWSDTQEVYETFAINYELDFGRFESEYVNSYVETVGVKSLPSPVKVGYTFVGWTLKADSTDYVTSIGEDVTGDVTLYAQWTEKESSMPKVIYVGAEKEYKTLAEALAAAGKGDTIVLDAGTYEGTTISKSVTIKGPNAGVNPNIETRAAEAVITSDLIIAADNVTINGISLTGKGRVKTANDQNTSNLVCEYIYVFDSDVNASSSDSATAPFDFSANSSYTVSDVKLLYSQIAADNAGRPMIIFANNIHNLTVDGNQFFGGFYNFNDGIKIGLNGTSGITGKLVITNNHFEEYAQYLIWLQRYGALEVELSNNSFKHIGQTVGAHPIIRFATYTGSADDQVYLNMAYNTLEEGLMVLRVDAASNLTADNALFEVNYNNVISTTDTLLINNDSPNAIVKCDSNYWGSAEVAESAFKNVTHTNDLTSAEEIPSEEEIWLNSKLTVGEGQTYATIAEALAAAKDGDEIYVAAGTYAEELTIDKSVTIYGPNYGVHGNAKRVDEAIITAVMTIAANGVVIDGVKFTEAGNIRVSANNVTITNVYMMPESTIAANTVNRQACIVDGANISDLVISNSYINAPGDANTYTKEYVAFNNVNNLTMDNNFITNRATTYTGSSSYEGARIYTSSGVYNITNNVFNWATDGYVLYLANISKVTELNIIGNVFDGNETVKHTATLALRTGSTTTVTNIIGNEFYNFAGSTYVFNGDTGSTVNIKYNYYDANTNFKLVTKGSAAISYDSNCYMAALDSDTTVTDYGVLTTLDQVKEGYAAWQIIQEIGDPEVYSNLSYELNGGTIPAGYDVKYLEGQKVDLYSASKEGYKFLGWSLDQEGTKFYKQIQKDWTGDLKLYAQWAEIFDVEYELDGGESNELVLSAVDGTRLELPTPTKYGNIFLGWSLEEGSDEYVSEITVTADTKLYANWLEATFFYVTYELNGGSIKYASRDELVADWLADYDYILGKDYKTVADINTGSFSDIDYHTFLDSTKVLPCGQTPREKWLWLAEYLLELSKRDLASNNCNVLGLNSLINQTGYSGDAVYGISYAFRAFLLETTIRPNSSYTSVDHSNYENANGFWNKLSSSEPKEYGYYEDGIVLPVANLENYKFVGWYKNADFSGEAVTTVSHSDDGVVLYAKFIEATPVSSITIDNKVAEIKRFETLQLTWTINPSDANIKTVTFKSSNPNVATVDDKGFITAIANGTATITITSKSSSGVSDSFVLEVYSPDHFDASYETESYVAIDSSVNLLAEYIKRDGSKEALTWSSLNEDVATVDANGKVTGVNAGLATIRATVASNPEVYFDFVVTVLDSEMSEALAFAVESHESNHFLHYDLNIGGAYLADVFGSVSKIFYNHKLEINDQYKAAGNASNDYYANSTKEQGLEFITVHYTAGFDASADTDNHADYFTSGSADVSIHYVTGNPGSDSNGATSEVYATLDHANGAWHAGDSNSRYYSNSDKTNAAGELVFSWMATGVKADDTALLDIVWTVSDDFYYEINGKKTTIKLPSTYDYKERSTNHIYNADGTISSQDNFYGGKFENRTPESFFNSQGFPVTVIDGEYYMGPTWWSFGQVVEGRICGSGGNLNSIGIESCVNKGSDLWYTWQVTAQLVASLMVQYDLGIERVKGHHFFDGKNCPQPMLENDLEIWYEFLELVEAEYALLTTYKDVTYTLKVEDKYSSVVSEYGRIIAQPEFSQVVTYTVEVTVGDKVETITLATAVEGMYNR